MAVEILKCATAKIFFWLWRFNFLAKSGCGDLNFQKLKVAVESVGTDKFFKDMAHISLIWSLLYGVFEMLHLLYKLRMARGQTIQF